MSERAADITFRPFTVLLGIIMGTIFAIFFCTCIVAFVFWFLRDESPRFAAELDGLIDVISIFSVLTVCAAFSFIGSLRNALWRFLPMAALWAGLGLAGWYYWP